MDSPALAASLSPLGWIRTYEDSAWATAGWPAGAVHGLADPLLAAPALPPLPGFAAAGSVPILRPGAALPLRASTAAAAGDADPLTGYLRAADGLAAEGLTAGEWFNPPAHADELYVISGSDAELEDLAGRLEADAWRLENRCPDRFRLPEQASGHRSLP